MSDPDEYVTRPYSHNRNDYKALYEFAWGLNVATAKQKAIWPLRLVKWVSMAFFWIVVPCVCIFLSCMTVLMALEGLPFDTVFPTGMVAVAITAITVMILRCDWLSMVRQHVVAANVQAQVKAGNIGPATVMQVTLNRGGIIERTEQPGRDPVEFRAAWHEVGRIAVERNQMFVEVGSHGWLIVPLTAFPGVAAFTAFGATLHRLKAEAEPASGQ